MNSVKPSNYYSNLAPSPEYIEKQVNDGILFYLYNMLTITLVKTFLNDKVGEMSKHNLKQAFVRRTTPDIQVFFC